MGRRSSRNTLTVSTIPAIMLTAIILSTLLTSGFSTIHSLALSEFPVCVANDPDPPAYYRIDLVSTGRVPGTGVSTAYGDLVFRSSPFAVTVTPEGSYNYDLSIRLKDVNYRGPGVFVAWLATSDLRKIRRLGALGDDLSVDAAVSWNKFLVVVSLEETDEPREKWKGPVVFRGISRSGLMHTMAGHGPFSREPCAAYGY